MPPQETLPTECDIAEIAQGTNVRAVDEGSPGFKELVASVRVHGILQPLLVRPYPANGAPGSFAYELVAGFRRREAARQAGLTSVPVRVVNVDDPTRAEVQLLENLMRRDLTPMEEAHAIHAYSEGTHAKPKEIATRIAKSETYIRDRLSLMNLRPKAQELLEKSELSVQVAVVLAGFPGDVQDAAIEDEYVLRDDVRDVRAGLTRLADEIKKAKAFAEKVAKSEFKVCPKCSGPPTQQSYSGLAVCAKYHEWSLIIGKPGGDSAPSTRARAGPARPSIDRKETRTLRGTMTPQEIMSEYLGRVKVDYIKVEAADGTANVEFHLSEKNVPDALRTKEYVTFALVPLAYTNGQQSQVVVDGYDGPARRKAKAVVRNFFAEFDDGPAPKTDGDMKEQIEKLLAGERADVEKRLGKVTDRELLERARDAEAAGAARASLMILMDQALESRSL